MPELTRNQQFFLLQPPPHHIHSHQHQQQDTHHLNCFLPLQPASSPSPSPSLATNQGKHNYWTHMWNNPSTHLTNTTTSPNYPPQPQNYSNSSSTSSSSSSSSCSCSNCTNCPSPEPSTMNYFPLFGHFGIDYQTDCDIICVIDFEATCENYGGRRPPNDAIMEIIEFPAFMVDTRTRSVISTFHEYVRPVINPKLSYFCTQLTGITQHMVDQADTFPKVLERFEKSISNLLIERGYSSFAIATDGPWDIAHFLARQCQIHELEFPEYAKRWINLKRVYADCYQINPICLDNMLTSLGIRFDGRRHSGYFDALHITKLLLKLLHDGAILYRNEMVTWDMMVGRKCWGNMDCGYIPFEQMFTFRYINA